MNPHTFLSASEDGTIRHFDLRDSSQILVDLRSERGSIDFYSVAINQMNPHYFVTGIKYWMDGWILTGVIGGCDPLVRMYDRRMLDKKSQECVKRFCPSHLINAPRGYAQKGHITGNI